MEAKTICRIMINVAMIILMLVLMASALTGDTMHELLGVYFGVFFIVHNVWNWRWYKGLIKGRYDVIRIFHTTVNLLLLVAMLALMASAVTISQNVFAFLGLKGGFVGRKIHVFAAYWSFILMSIHIGLHWGMLANVARKLTKTAAVSRPRTFVLRTAAILIATYGVYASFSRDMGSKLILYYTFDFWNNNQPVILVFFDYLSIMELYVYVTYYVLKWIGITRKD